MKQNGEFPKERVKAILESVATEVCSVDSASLMLESMFVEYGNARFREEKKKKDKKKADLECNLGIYSFIVVALLVVSWMVFNIKATIEAGPKEVEDCRRGEYLKCYDHYVNNGYYRQQLLKANYYWATGKNIEEPQKKE